MIDQVATVFDELSRRAGWTGDDDLVFVSPTGDHIEDSALRRRFYGALKAAGLKRIRFHDLRHSFGTLAVQVFPLTDVKAYMGHADIATTMIYVHKGRRRPEAVECFAHGSDPSPRSTGCGVGMAISAQTRKILWARAGNQCAKCNAVLLAPHEIAPGSPPVIGQECHIVALAPGGPRGDEGPRVELDSYENLILLCANCHALVDARPDLFPYPDLRHAYLGCRRTGSRSCCPSRLTSAPRRSFPGPG